MKASFYVTSQREVSLFMTVKAGKVSGAESTPFPLKQGWTYDTLETCVEGYIKANIAPNRKIKQMYYKRNRGKGVVFLNGDGDIPALLKEYPVCYPTGKKKARQDCVLYLAVDLEGKLAHYYAYFSRIRIFRSSKNKFMLLLYFVEWSWIKSNNYMTIVSMVIIQRQFALSCSLC